MKVEVVRAWPRRFESVGLELGEGATLAEAVAAAGFQDDAQITGYAVFGVKAAADTRLRDGDRVELLRALQIDPKDARRRRAADRPLKK
ncbi:MULTISPECIES: RnfH family protein [Lysobacter]|uniref:RnfH family protein n=1 Tax=Lysobacter TaxID=68 RepID=UPI001F33810D|nr:MULTISPECIES: RnfH family protein [Lysobacter]UJB21657.1 RnfH family protein [Lysobacter capsici]UJQ29226.1 RnfH family protein [Lysobacter gummosus]